MSDWTSPWVLIPAFVALSIVCAPAAAKMLERSRRATPVATVPTYTLMAGDREVPVWKLVAQTYAEVKQGKPRSDILLEWLLARMPNGHGKFTLRIESVGVGEGICFIGGWSSGTGSIYVTMRPDFLHDFRLDVFGDEQHATIIKLQYEAVLRQVVNVDAYYRGEH